MPQHALPSIGSNDPERDIGSRGYVVKMRRIHSPRVKGGDLVAVIVSCNEGLRCVGMVDDFNPVGRDAVSEHPLDVVVRVRTHCRKWHANIAEKAHVVGNIAGTAAKLAAQLWHEK